MENLRLCLFDVTDNSEVEGLTDVPAITVPRPGELLHFWQDNFPLQVEGGRWDFVVQRVEHDFRRMATGGTVTHSVLVFVEPRPRPMQIVTVPIPDFTGAGR